jgi:hypothetical protein
MQHPPQLGAARSQADDQGPYFEIPAGRQFDELIAGVSYG